MIVRFRKQLIQWKFLERRHTHNLHKSVEGQTHGALGRLGECAYAIRPSVRPFVHFAKDPFAPHLM